MQLPFVRTSFLTGSQSGADTRGARVLKIANTLLILSVMTTFIFLFVQSKNNSRLKEEKNKLVSTVKTMSGPLVSPPSVQVGDIVPSFEAVNLEGKRTDIVYNGSSKYLLYIFSPQCSVCIEQFHIWNQIASRAKLKNYRVIGLSLDPQDAKANLSMVDHNFEVCLMSSTPVQRAYRVVAVPLVMLVSPQGNVEWVHYGALSEDKTKEISSIMGLE